MALSAASTTGGRSAKIGIANLQADDVLSAGFERKNAVCHGNGGRLTDQLELCVEV
jgi:hypothetical protein